jgi:hypothetical protein
LAIPICQVSAIAWCLNPFNRGDLTGK